MRSWSPSHHLKTTAEPVVNAWPPTRQQWRAEQRSSARPNRADLPPRPEAPPARTSTPGMAAPLAPLVSSATRAGSGPAKGKQNNGGPDAGKRTALANREAAGREIEGACEALHRSEAILIQLKLVGAAVPNVSPMINEARHACAQAAASFRANAFVSAGEYGAASSALARAVCMVLLREPRSRGSRPGNEGGIGNHRPGTGDHRPSQDEFSAVESRISRIVWLFEYGTLPAEVIEQARKIASWSDELFREAQQLFRNGAWEAAREFLQAAEAAALSAEHICKMCYLKEG